MKQQISVKDLGLVPYQAAWDYQERLLQENVQRKGAARSGETAVSAPVPTQHYLLFCEHPPVYTLGKSGHLENLLLSRQQLEEKGIAFVQTNRGGDITFHGEGQVVGYPILDLERFFTDIGKYLRFLEEVIIRMLADYGVKGERSAGETGVWIDPEVPGRARKICAMGVRCSRWVTMHGFAVNIQTDMGYFSNIIACGIADKQVTSLDREIGRAVPLGEVREKITRYFGEVFEAEMISRDN
ncbi:lipoyl(octanoyl) transferase LipB [Chitinophaga lutea]